MIPCQLIFGQQEIQGGEETGRGGGWACGGTSVMRQGPWPRSAQALPPAEPASDPSPACHQLVEPSHLLAPTSGVGQTVSQGGEWGVAGHGEPSMQGGTESRFHTGAHRPSPWHRSILMCLIRPGSPHCNTSQESIPHPKSQRSKLVLPGLPLLLKKLPANVGPTDSIPDPGRAYRPRSS